MKETNFFLNDLLKNYEKIEAIPCLDKLETHKFGDFARLECISDSLKASNSPYHVVAGKSHYKLYAQADLETLSKEYDRVILVSSHADNLQEKSSFSVDYEKNMVHGCGDNASTIGVSLTLMEKCPLPRNVLFVATADEEDKGKGAKKAAKKVREFFPAPGAVRAIVLDVTYGFCNGADFSLENDFVLTEGDGEEYALSVFNALKEKQLHWDYLYAKDEAGDNGEFVTVPKMLSLMGENCNQNKAGAGNDDESYLYYKRGCTAFSLCLPCSAISCSAMHSDYGFDISIPQYINYALALKTIVENAA